MFVNVICILKNMSLLFITLNANCNYFQRSLCVSNKSSYCNMIYHTVYIKMYKRVIHEISKY